MENVIESKSFGKATIYRLSMFGYSKIEAKEGNFERGKYAQYNSAVNVTFKEPRQKKARGFTDSNTPCMATLILEGWGHPDPEGSFTEEKDEGGNITSRITKYGSCDVRWALDFNAKMDAYLVVSGSKVVEDFRGVSPYDGRKIG